MRPIAFAGLLFLAACGEGEPVAADNEAQANAVQTANQVAAANLQAAAAVPPARCAPALTPELERESIVEALGGQKASAARLDALKGKAGATFDAAAESLCKAGKLDPKLLRPFRTLLIQNGGGATEATFYEDPHEFSGEDLIFQWIFAESGLQVPPQEDVEAGLLCWAKPDLPECAEREP